MILLRGVCIGALDARGYRIFLIKTLFTIFVFAQLNSHNREKEMKREKNPHK